MAKADLRLGAKVRALRKERGLTQVELARRLEISASYLNLIEKDQRALTAPLLVSIARQFEVEIDAFTEDADDQLTADLAEVFADPLLGARTVGSGDMRDQVGAAPELARALTRLYRAYQDSRQTVDSLASQIYDTHQDVDSRGRTPLASEEVSDFIQRRGNYFSSLERAAERLHERAQLRRPELYGGLVEYLGRAHGVRVDMVRFDSNGGTIRRFDPATRVLELAEVMSASSRVFQTAVQIGLLDHGELLDELCTDSILSGSASRKLARMVLANYFAGAVLMPYDAMLAEARRERYDIELLCHRFGASFEQVCQRLTTLRRPDAEGIPLHMIRVDLAGNISKRYSGSGIRFARFAGACPRWNVFSAFLNPGAIRVQVSVMPDGQAFFCVARTIPKGRGGFSTPHTVQAIGLGCPVRYAREMVYSDGVEAESLEAAVPVGVTCRLCDRVDCAQRAFPSIRSGLELDENVRGPSFFAPPVDDAPGS